MKKKTGKRKTWLVKRKKK